MDKVLGNERPQIPLELCYWNPPQILAQSILNRSILMKIYDHARISGFVVLEFNCTETYYLNFETITNIFINTVFYNIYMVYILYKYV